MNDDDFYATVHGSKYSVGSFDHGFLGEFLEYDDVLNAVSEWADLNKWTPDLWFVSDHGNVDDQPTEYIACNSKELKSNRQISRYVWDCLWFVSDHGNVDD